MLSATHHYPVSTATPHRRVPFAASFLLHAAIGCLGIVWLQRTLPAPPAEEQATAVVFQVPAPGATPAPVPATPPPLQPVAAAPPPRPVLPPPPVEQATPSPLAEAPAASPLPTPPPVPREPPPKPSPRTARPQTHPIARALPQPATPATQAASKSATAPAPVATPPAPISVTWRQALEAWLADHRRYPEAARRRNEQGTVALHVEVDRSGRVMEVVVVHGSGSSSLDNAAASMLRNATLPAFPATMSQDRVELDIPLQYVLTD